ncbi:MAG: hypothetical protein IJU23_08875 [Proteobacteria bacterium]|nr:hypothetical protein [Pseudomonadota bacterium]
MQYRRPILSLFILALLVPTFSSCKKNTQPDTAVQDIAASETAPEQASADAPAAQPPASESETPQPQKESAPSLPPIDESAAIIEKKPETDSNAAPQPDVDQPDPCDPWKTNPLFHDNHLLHYQVQLENEAFGVDDDDFECDENGDCTRDVTFDLNCSVVRIGQNRGYCASKIECKASPAKYQNEIPDLLDGYWFRDANGFYLINANSRFFQVSDIKKESGNCTKTKYIECKPGTLAHDFSFFSDLIPTIPTATKESVYESEYYEDSDTTRSWDVTFKNNIWCSTNEVSGPDSTETQICVSDSLGIASFKDSFSGGSNRDITGKLVQ